MTVETLDLDHVEQVVAALEKAGLRRPGGPVHPPRLTPSFPAFVRVGYRRAGAGLIEPGGAGPLDERDHLLLDLGQHLGVHAVEGGVVVDRLRQVLAHGLTKLNSSMTRGST